MPALYEVEGLSKKDADVRWPARSCSSQSKVQDK